jgi:2,3-bisphosphoglycerate-independent phosphoglycerate mutase
VVNELSNEMRRVLESHSINAQRVAEGLNPANVVLLRGCGCRIKARGTGRMQWRAHAAELGTWARTF